ncbi:MAG: Trp family transcriptional regulator [Candidatus Levyibacteriota bacterium]
MKRRYQFLQENDIFEALNKVRDALLAAKSGEDVDDVMNGILTFDERMKVGRRIQIAQCLLNGMTMGEIKDLLKVGGSTIEHVAARLSKYEKCFKLIGERGKKVKREYENKAYVLHGGSTKIFKTRGHTGFKRKSVKR